MPGPCLAYAGRNTDITGKFNVEGTNVAGNVYHGKVEITKNADTYELVWKIGENEIQKGIGILQEDILSVIFYTADEHGVVSYRVKKGPILAGKWASVGGNGKVQTELLTK